jgi:hypothetical protein
VIYIAEEKRPSEEMIAKGFEANPAGAGIAWREPNPETGAVEVVWEKGLDLDEIQEYCARVPMPYIAHFRVPSCGGLNAVLCHPFPIEVESSLALSGRTDGYVLFHNGHWTRWKDHILELAVRRSIRLPGGKWSDTRAMAITAAYHGLAILEMIDEKTVAFGPTECEVTGIWSKVNDIWVSNTGWQTGFRGGYGYHGGEGHDWQTKMCRETRCTKDRMAGSEYCKDHQIPVINGHKGSNGGDPGQQKFLGCGPIIETGENKQEKVQQGEEKVREALEGTEEEEKVTDIISARQKMKAWACGLNPKPFKNGGRSLAAAVANGQHTDPMIM